MRRTLLRGLLGSLAVAVLLGGVVGGLAIRAKTRNVLGGTALLFEVKGDPPSAAELARLTDTLQTRLDPDDLDFIVVRPVAPNRVEVLVPQLFGYPDDDHATLVDGVRQAAVRKGLVEFRILANPADDREAIALARTLLDSPTEQDREEMATAAEKGLPPPVPSGTFRVRAAGDAEAEVAYQWVELGKEERESLGLSERYAGVGKAIQGRDGETYANHFYDEVAAVRGKTLVPNFDPEQEPVYFSREFAKKERTAGEAGKTVEYFVLSRVSDADALKVQGDVRLTAYSSVDPDGRPEVMFNFTAGADRFTALTRRNRPTGDHYRHLAVILDGEVVTAPTLRDVLSGRGVIWGGYDVRSADRLAGLLRAGVLNAELVPAGQSPLDPAGEEVVRNKVAAAATRGGLMTGGGTAAGVFVLLAGLTVLVAWVRRPRPGASL